MLLVDMKIYWVLQRGMVFFVLSIQANKVVLSFARFDIENIFYWLLSSFCRNDNGDLPSFFIFFT